MRFRISVLLARMVGLWVCNRWMSVRRARQATTAEVQRCWSRLAIALLVSIVVVGLVQRHRMLAATTYVLLASIVLLEVLHLNHAVKDTTATTLALGLWNSVQAARQVITVVRLLLRHLLASVMLDITVLALQPLPRRKME